MDMFHQMHRVKQISLTGAWRATALIHPGDGAFFTQDHCAASMCFFVLNLAYLDPFYINNRIRKHGNN
jgi:hypothetical protein